ncbi:hypothetical protein [Bradyrhizobium sp. LMTR 3]|uniref:hypothetical protein n=1 Tax=Bradyrhizobium sp. LMTR 3 TaxID=189873 RepID=UPI00159EF8DE|nr:hypothetical protein [Bradyrhizobium sp. LMTR 3]
MYPKVKMFIAGNERGSSGKSEKILNPASGQAIGETRYAYEPILIVRPKLRASA